MEIAIDEQIAELGRMTVTQLRQKYAEVFGEEILTNALYSGMVDHKGVLYPGEHERIVDQRVWDKVQTMLRQNGRGNGSYAKNKYGALLRGVLFCAHYDTAMMHTYTAKGPRRYRYYVCYKAQQKGWQNCRTKSVAAEAIERAVLNSIRRLSSDPPTGGQF